MVDPRWEKESVWDSSSDEEDGPAKKKSKKEKKEKKSKKGKKHKKASSVLGGGEGFAARARAGGAASMFTQHRSRRHGIYVANGYM